MPTPLDGHCKHCRIAMDMPGCDDAEKSDQESPDYCRPCADHFREEKRYQDHLKRGGKPFTAGMSAGKGRMGRRIV